MNREPHGPGHGSTPTLLEDAVRRGARYLAGLEGRAVQPSAHAVAGLSRLDEPLNDTPDDPAIVLAQLDELVSPATMAMAGPRADP